VNNFIPGQRWISQTESELGLGLILNVESNRLTVLYLATGVQRIYAKDNAPLTRAIFSVGDKIESADDIQLIVQEVIEKAGLLTYIGVDQDGNQQILEEMELNHHIQFNKPQDRLLTGQFDPTAWFNLRYQTWCRQQQHQTSEVKGLLGARAVLIAHQLYIAHEVANRLQPRVMLADEVGLGKTIEAGLILHYRLVNGLSQRLLIIVPESLLHQWLVEMLRRFNLQFSLFDEQRCQAIEDDNPFLTAQLVLSSQEFFSAHPQRQQQALAAGWDIVVVDEAHHLEWDESKPSPEYQFVEQLAHQSPGLILLTATPEQLGKASHFARLRLLDPDRFYQLQQFLTEETLFEPVAQIVNLLVSGDLLSEQQCRALQAIVKDNSIVRLLATVNQQNKAAENNRKELVNLLLDHHGTGRVLFRNSRQTVQGFPQRQCYGYPLKPTPDASQLTDDPYFIWLIDKLVTLQANDEKALLICHQAEQVVQLAHTLKHKRGIATAVFHEGMSIIERDRSAAYFADPDNSVSLLICSEMGSEGRNFQFVHQLILFDLPDNPDLLQQRIGRLDRIGQKHIIQLHIPYVINSVQHKLYRWYQEGLDLFKRNNPAATEVATVLADELKTILTQSDQQTLETFITKTAQLNQQLEQRIQRGRDPLLELNSCRQTVAQNLIEQVNTLDQDTSLWRYLEALFDCYGVEIDYHSPDCHILKPSENLRVSYFPMLPEDGVTVTVSRSVALAREDMQFITQEHPMVLSAMDLVLSSETGNSALSVIHHPDLKERQFLLEMVFIIECSAPAELKIGRFLPSTPIRILIDQNQHNLTESIPHNQLQETTDKVDKDQIISFLANQRLLIEQIISLAQSLADYKMQQLISATRPRMLNYLTTEIKRLVRLKKINPSIKTAEIEQLKEMTLLADNNIQQAQLRLDAVRFLITR